MRKINKINKNIIIGISIAVILIFGGIFIYIFLQKGKISQIETPKPTPQVEEIAESFKPGEIGEISEETKEKEIPPLPPVIFNTSGIISEIKTDRLIVQGSGLNFVDQKPRELTIIFTNSTIVNDSVKKSYYQGFEGLRNLKPGMKISIEGTENIRGKIEFEVSSLNILP